jgi:hypothetical protein
LLHRRANRLLRLLPGGDHCPASVDDVVDTISIYVMIAAVASPV